MSEALIVHHARRSCDLKRNVPYPVKLTQTQIRVRGKVCKVSRSRQVLGNQSATNEAP